MTKREALKICIELWTWLAENPEEDKKNWPGWITHGKMELTCPCCEYVGALDRFSNKCEVKCPVSWGFKESGSYYPCCHSKSPFTRWKYSKQNKTRTKYALQVVQLAEYALAKLKED
jgi:hypothetical protein